MKPAPTLGGYKAVSRLYNGLMTGLVLTLVTRAGEDAAARFVFGHFRRQHLEKFLPGLKKLGLDGLPDAVACAQYHYFSNALGGVKTEFMPESDRKAWVRYPPPRWIWQGAAICAVPARVNEAMLHGWHGHNGVSLGNPRLGFVCTGQTVEGAPGLEGYYFDYGREIAESERVRFVVDEPAPDFDPAKAPRLDSAAWPEARLRKVERSYAMEYVRSLAPTLFDLFGPEGTREHLGRAARLIGMQFYDETAELLGVRAGSARAFADYLGGLAAAQGEDVEIEEHGAAVVVRQVGWRLMDGLALDPVVFAAWNELFEGALAVHNSRLRLSSSRDAVGIVWRIEG
ncbi:MAG TPA: hypothetical protein VHY34_05745 [Caulobacteraceae bacterium]|jgi:hypothetical protein|nr:hypothetical protein [Caulobacteraceae bacterium]